MTVNHTATVQFDKLYVRAAYNYAGSSDFTDNFHKGRPLLQLMRERRLTDSGGNQIAHRVRLGTTAQGGSYRKGQRMDIVDVNNDTQANFDWAFYWEPCPLYFQDKFKAMAGARKHMVGRAQELAETNADECMERLQQLILEHMCASSQADSADIEPILTYVKATGAAGGLDPSNAEQATWAAQINANTVDFSAVGPQRLRTLSNDCSQGLKFQTDAYVLTQAFHEEALEIGDNKVQINQEARTSGGTKNADLGLENLTINGKIAIWDPTWSTTQSSTVLALNFGAIHLVEAPEYAFKFSGMESMRSDGVNADVDWLNWVGQLTVRNRRALGALTNVS